MAWARIDDGILDHPKVLMAGEDAGNLFIRSIIWCNKHLTDGFIPHEACTIFTRKRDWRKHVAALLRVGLWAETEGGYRIRGFLEHNASAEEVKQKREDAAERQRKSREAKAAQSQVSHENVTRDKRVTSASVTAPSPLLSSPLQIQEKRDPPVVPQGDDDVGAPPAKSTRRKRELSEASLAVQSEIEKLAEVTYPPATFDALEARLKAKDLTLDDALAVVRYAATDPFWGREVKLDPSTIFRPAHWPGLLGKARAKPQGGSFDFPPPRRGQDPDEHRRVMEKYRDVV